jgi:hypothetical protein
MVAFDWTQIVDSGSFIAHQLGFVIRILRANFSVARMAADAAVSSSRERWAAAIAHFLRWATLRAWMGYAVL